MRVQYVGKQPYKVDRMFSSGGVWEHQGAVVSIVPDSLAQKMIDFAPGEYGPVSDDASVREGTHETVGTVPAGDSAIDRIMIPQAGTAKSRCAMPSSSRSRLTRPSISALTSPPGRAACS